MLLTSDDLIRLIVVLLIIFIVILVVKKAFRFACFLIALMCLYQIGFMFSQTDLNNHFPFNKYFKYDILKSVTSVWEDTDKDKFKDDISNEVDDIVDKAGDIINKFNNKPIDVPEEDTSVP